MSADHTPAPANIEQYSALQIMALNTHMIVILQWSEAHQPEWRSKVQSTEYLDIFLPKIYTDLII